MSVLTGTTQRLAFDLTRRDPVVDASTGEEIRLWQAGRTLFQCGLFKDEPGEDSIVDDISDLVSATLIVRRTNAQGTALINKTITSFSLPTFEEWDEEDGQHFTIPLTETETNQVLPQNGTLKVYYVVQVTTTSGSYVAGQGYGEIVNVGLSAGLPSVPTPDPYVFTGAVTMGSLTVTGTIVAAGGITGVIAASGISVLDFVDVRWHGVDVTGATDSTAELNAARAAARDEGAYLWLPLNAIIKVSSTLAITEEETWIGDGKEGAVTSGTKILWAGVSGGTILTITSVERGVHLEGITFNGGGLAATCVVIDSSSFGTYRNLKIDGFTTGEGLWIKAAHDVSKFNQFTGLIIDGTGNGSSCLRLGQSTDNDDPNQNTFIATHLTTSGVRVCIRLGNCDYNTFNDTICYHSGPGVNSASVWINSDDHPANTRPNGNVFNRITLNSTAGKGWLQDASSTSLLSPNTVIMYGRSNGEALPEFSGANPATLIVQDEYGNYTLNTMLCRGPVTIGTPIDNIGVAQPSLTVYGQSFIKQRALTDVTGISILGSNYNVNSDSFGFSLGGTTATGTIASIAKAGMGRFQAQNLTSLMFDSNNDISFYFAPSGVERVRISSSGLNIGNGNANLSKFFSANITWNIPSTVTGGFQTSDFTVTGMSATDLVFPISYYGIIVVECFTNVARLVYYNTTGSTQDPPSTSLTLNIFKK